MGRPFWRESELARGLVSWVSFEGGTSDEKKYVFKWKGSSPKCLLDWRGGRVADSNLGYIARQPRRPTGWDNVGVKTVIHNHLLS